ncbi:MAG TPA: DUF2117 domain-containing protein [Methanophagales archaeon]|nr:DUF2117 domain-containing protein [Methanophagales archaeon]
MKTLGLLIHGPEVIDEGEAGEAIETIKGSGFELEASLGGITGKTAVIDAGLRYVIDISKDRKPSEVLDDFVNRRKDFILLVNHAKTEESGFMLGEGILRNFIDRGGAKETLSFVQLEYSNRIIIPWLMKPGDGDIYRQITGIFSDFAERAPYKLESRCKKESDLVYREIKGVHPGEKIVVNGVVIGMSSQDNTVTLVAKEGNLVKILGGSLIGHNLEKLPSIDLKSAMIKTGSLIRRTKPKRVRIETASRKGKQKACFFYTVENLFPKIEEVDADIAVAVVIGDDTTSIAGDILKRFGIPMIGITDGDADGLIEGIRSGGLEEYAEFLPQDSMIIRLKPDRDDIIGEKVKKGIFKGGEEIELEGNVEQQLEVLKHRILDLADGDIIGVLSSASPDGEKRKRKTYETIIQ